MSAQRQQMGYELVDVARNAMQKAEEANHLAEHLFTALVGHSPNDGSSNAKELEQVAVEAGIHPMMMDFLHRAHANLNRTIETLQALTQEFVLGDLPSVSEALPPDDFSERGPPPRHRHPTEKPR